MIPYYRMAPVSEPVTFSTRWADTEADRCDAPVAAVTAEYRVISHERDERGAALSQRKSLRAVLIAREARLVS